MYAAICAPSAAVAVPVRYGVLIGARLLVSVVRVVSVLRLTLPRAERLTPGLRRPIDPFVGGNLL
ncbi:hypothetical protein GCM10010446_59910 [Streptomyces enissocaesilis]|uniref:Uncharacterized protein n=1 Tax=Streptomyces enissocaesilis TaxID=332589 RepID=A0ABP6K708_9ACTN